MHVESTVTRYCCFTDCQGLASDYSHTVRHRIRTLLVTLQVAIPQLRPTPQLILDDEHGIERDVRLFIL